MNEHYQLSGTGFGDKDSEILPKMDRPDVYRINAFRVLQVPVTASAREVSAQLRKLDLMEKLGDAGETVRGIMPFVPPPDSHARREAAQRLNDPELRLIDELFWFWPLSPSLSEDMDEALAAIERNDFSEAVSIWQRHETEGSEANVSMHNLAIMYHALALDLEHLEARQPLSKEQIQQKRDYWAQSFARWQILLDHDGFWHRLAERVRILDDPRITIHTVRGIQAGLPLALLSINATLAVQAAQQDNHGNVRYHISLMRESGFDKAMVDAAMRRAVAPIRDRVKIICTNAASETDKVPEHTAQVTHNVIDQTSRLLSTLDMLLPAGHPTLEAAHDEVALLILKSQIALGNKTRDWDTPLGLLEQALQIACSASTRQHIEDNIRIFRDNLLYVTCWFCGQHTPDHQSTSEVKMYANVTRSGGYVYFHKITVGVPRCTRCKSSHARRRISAIWGVVSGAVLGSLATYGIGVVAYPDSGGVSLIAIPVGILAGYLIGCAIGQLPSGVKPESSKKKFPRVKTMQSEGWMLGEKPPEVG